MLSLLPNPLTYRMRTVEKEQLKTRQKCLLVKERVQYFVSLLKGKKKRKKNQMDISSGSNFKLA